MVNRVQKKPLSFFASLRLRVNSLVISSHLAFNENKVISRKGAKIKAWASAGRSNHSWAGEGKSQRAKLKSGAIRTNAISVAV
jgi:hypothetical protein